MIRKYSFGENFEQACSFIARFYGSLCNCLVLQEIAMFVCLTRLTFACITEMNDFDVNLEIEKF